MSRSTECKFLLERRGGGVERELARLSIGAAKLANLVALTTR